MKKVKLFEDFINESVNVKYWADYHEKSKKITSVSKVSRAVEDEVEEWNLNNEDGKDNEVTNGDEKKVMNLAHDFFKAAGWISTDVIQAMIAQESIGEAIVNEAKDATREEIMDLMETKYKIRFVRTSEEFDGEKDGIWIAGDNGEELSGNKIFDYYNKSAKYKNGVLKTVVDAIEKKGWWFSWNDPGTMMIWPKN